MDMTVSNTILSQLGGRRFTMMTGAKNLLGDANSLSFRLPGSGGFCKDGINYVKIELTPGDDYTVTFARIRGIKVTEISKHENIYCDQLQDVFTDATGLCTAL